MPEKKVNIYNQENCSASHIGIEVTDLYQMELFYKKILGFITEYHYVSKNTPGLKTAFLIKGDVRVELLQRNLIDITGNNNNNKHIIHLEQFRKAPYPRLKRQLILFINRISKNAETTATRQIHLALNGDDIKKEYQRIKALGIKITAPRETGDGYLECLLNDPEGNTIEIAQRIKSFPVYPIKAVIFDLDGTLIDSEPNYYKADIKFFTEFGLTITPEIKQKYIGLSSKLTISELKQQYHLIPSVDDLLNKLDTYYLEFARQQTRIFPEMLKLLQILKAAGYRLAIASGSSQRVLNALLPELGLVPYFDLIISADEITNGKPAPDIFLETAQRLQVAPENCLVLEDSQYGVEAAKRAFMYCLAVPYLTQNLADSFMTADLLFPEGMNEFSADKALKWLESH